MLHNLVHKVLKNEIAWNLAKNLRFRKNELYIFNFHQVTEYPAEFVKESRISVTLEEFKESIDFINQIFTIIDPRELEMFHPTNKPLALITFDDAWSGIYSAIYEILAPRKIRPIVFLNYGTVISGTDLSAARAYMHKVNPESQLLEDGDFVRKFELGLSKKEEFRNYQGELITERQIQHLDNESLCIFGNHLFRHHNSARLKDSEFIESFLQNKMHLDRLLNSKGYFAFPFGDPKSHWTRGQLQWLLSHRQKVFFTGNRKNALSKTKVTHLYGRFHLGVRGESIQQIWIKVCKSRALEVDDIIRTCGL